MKEHAFVSKKVQVLQKHKMVKILWQKIQTGKKTILI